MSFEKCYFAHPKLNDCTLFTLHVDFKGSVTAVNGRLDSKGQQGQGKT